MFKKNATKLTELMKFGSTSVRLKGKNVRLKTPACRALKRISNKTGIITIILSFCYLSKAILAVGQSIWLLGCFDITKSGPV